MGYCTVCRCRLCYCECKTDGQRIAAQVQERMRSELGRTPTNDELAARLGLPLSAVEWLTMERTV